MLEQGLPPEFTQYIPYVLEEHAAMVARAEARLFFDYLREDSVLEREPFERLAADGQLRAYRHTGFWDCMDTYKDAVMLNDLWEAGRAPWKESA